MGDQTEVTHPIKYVDDASRPASMQPVVVGPRTNADESYSALVAIFNTLLLRSNVSLPSFGDDSIGSDRMQELIGKSITSSASFASSGGRRVFHLFYLVSLLPSVPLADEQPTAVLVLLHISKFYPFQHIIHKFYLTILHFCPFQTPNGRQLCIRERR